MALSSPFCHAYKDLINTVEQNLLLLDFVLLHM